MQLTPENLINTIKPRIVRNLEDLQSETVKANTPFVPIKTGALRTSLRYLSGVTEYPNRIEVVYRSHLHYAGIQNKRRGFGDRWQKAFLQGLSSADLLKQPKIGLADADASGRPFRSGPSGIEFLD